MEHSEGKSRVKQSARLAGWVSQDPRSCLECIHCKLAIPEDSEYECELQGMLCGEYDSCDLFMKKPNDLNQPEERSE